jgi:hypothetical protein
MLPSEAATLLNVYIVELGVAEVVTVKLTCDPLTEVNTGDIPSVAVMTGVLEFDNCLLKVTDKLYNVFSSVGCVPFHPTIVGGVLRRIGPATVRPSTLASIDPSTDVRPLKVKLTLPVDRDVQANFTCFPIMLIGTILVGVPLLAVIEAHVLISLLNTAIRESVFV